MIFGIASILRRQLCSSALPVASIHAASASSAYYSSAGLKDLQSLLEPLEDSSKTLKSTRMESLQAGGVTATRPLNLCNAVNDGLHVAMDTDPR